MLYIRMLLSIAVTLYTSRVVLEVLGVEDYGIYGVVGSVVTMFAFLNSSMSGATSRFLMYEMGKGDVLRLRDTFSSALIIHISIALLVFVLAETVGLWFLCNKLVIPEGRMEAAHWVYQCSVISTMLGFTQVPYNASIIANERMGVYAYIEILNVSLKLLIVYLLPIFELDKLKLYAVLVLAVSVIVMMTYRIYCMRNFPESHFRFVWKKDILRPMLSFTGWDFYGNMCVTARVQGTNFLINNFFGVVANAASSIATTVNGAVSGLASNIITAFRPQIVKSYSQHNWVKMQSMLDNAVKFSTLFLITLSIPILFETSFILQLWLGEVPAYVEPFVRLTLITNCFGVINSAITIGIHSTGNIKRLSVFTGTLYLLTLPVSFLFLKFGYDALIVYVVTLFSSILILMIDLWIVKKQINNIQILTTLKNIAISILIGVFSVIVLFFIFKRVDVGFKRLILVTISDIVIMSLSTFVFALNSNQRTFVYKYFLNKLNLKRKGA